MLAALFTELVPSHQGRVSQRLPLPVADLPIHLSSKAMYDYDDTDGSRADFSLLALLSELTGGLRNWIDARVTTALALLCFTFSTLLPSILFGSAAHNARNLCACRCYTR